MLRRWPATRACPQVLAVCDDAAVIGAPFYVMERVEGHVITTEVPAALDTPEERRRIGEELVDALVEIHAVDWQARAWRASASRPATSSASCGASSGLWEHNRTREIPAVETVGEWLATNMPESGPATIVHGDYRLGNTMFAPEAPARLVGGLRLGDGDDRRPAGRPRLPVHAVGRPRRPAAGHVRAVGASRASEGFPLRAELVARYEERSGRSMTDIRWYQTLALWKSIVFMEGNYKRAVTGATDDPYLKALRRGVDRARRARAEAMARGR